MTQPTSRSAKQASKHMRLYLSHPWYLCAVRLGTWPAFWLMDVAALVNRSMDAHEIDVLEQYGDGIGILRTTLHYWPTNGSNAWGQVDPTHTARSHHTMLPDSRLSQFSCSRIVFVTCCVVRAGQRHAAR